MKVTKVKIYDLYKDVFKRSTLIAIPNLSNLLSVPGSEFSKWEVFTQIVRDALLKYEYYYPLYIQQKMYIEVNSISRIGRYSPNFEAYLNGLIDDESITLPIATCVGLSQNGYVGSQYPLRSFKFENDEFSEFWYSTGVYWANCICKRPLIEDYIRLESSDDNSHKPTDKCAIYFMEMNQNNTYTIFRDQVYVELCKYLTNIKKNLNLQNLPVDLFQGLEEDFNRVDSNLQTTYQSALKSGYYIV